ncbi:MAG: ABC transporter ATP-binding protein, partial [Segetibacter sp.]|nr:ABC transporter ATP-binding protein [Segetibacter sp.]
NDLAEVRNKEIGFIFQQFNLLPRLSAAENVALPLVYAGVAKKERIDRAMDVLSKVGLADRSHHKPNELSGGQIHRVAIARALVNNPAIILADEPTGNLDSKTSVEVMEIFGKIQSAGNTVVLVTHEEDIASYAKRVVRLRDGLIESDKIVIPTNNPERVPVT